MNKKMRVSLHNGRGLSTHNDRSFIKKLTPDELSKKATHIDFFKTKNNYYRATKYAGKKLENGTTFKEIELSYYEKYFGKALELTNQNYINQGHKERVKTIKDWYESKQKAPFETILQVGDMYSDINEQKFKKMCFEYVNYVNQNYGKNIKNLDFAIHFDEASPHMHLRQVFLYQENGVLKIGQNKALEQLGIEPPNPNKKLSRKNNRKMTLDKHLREVRQGIAKSHGYDIETKPRIGVKHKDKEQYINDQIAKKQAELDSLNKHIEHVIKTPKPGEFKGFKNNLEALGYTLVSNNELESLQNAYKSLEDKSLGLERRLNYNAVDRAEIKNLKENQVALIKKAKNEANQIKNKAHEEASIILKDAKMTLDKYTDLINYKNRWERIRQKFPEKVQSLEYEYQQSMKKAKNKHIDRDDFYR